MRSRILNLDHALILATGRIRKGEFKVFRFLLRSISLMGDGYLWIALLGVALAKGRREAASAGLIGAGLGIGGSLLLKRAYRRARPADGANWSRFVAPDRYSFPSGHTSTAFALATITVSHWPEIAAALWIAAFLIAASRVVLGFHYLSDVVAGAALGFLSGLTADLIVS